MSDRSKWIWMPHAGHFCCAKWCQFRLNTYVGGYIVSTVGEYIPPSEVREIKAEVRGIQLNGKGDNREADYMKKLGYESLGIDPEYIYETMVFEARKSSEKCCPYTIIVDKDKEQIRYKTRGEAVEGHMKLCEKWSKMRKGK